MKWPRQQIKLCSTNAAVLNDGILYVYLSRPGAAD